MSEVITIRGARHVVTECGVCGVVYTVPEVVHDFQQREGGYHYCPNNHGWGWTKENSESGKIRRERDLLKQQIAQKDDEIAAEKRRREEAEKAVAGAANAATKMKKRAAAGTCPCCQRTFSRMSEHMKRQHPEFVQATGAKVVKLRQVKP